MAGELVLEGRSKQLDDALRLYREGLKLSQARFSRSRELSPKDYITGNAYLRWKESMTDSNGRRYEASFSASRVKRGPDAGNLQIRPIYRDIKRILGRDGKLMLVSDIEPRDGKENWIPTFIGFNLATQGSSNLPRAWPRHLGFNVITEFSGAPDGWEITSSMVASICDRAGSDKVVQGTREIMDGIAKNERKDRGQGPSVTDCYTWLSRRWVHIEKNQVRISSEMIVGDALKIFDVGFSPIEL